MRLRLPSSILIEACVRTLSVLDRRTTGAAAAEAEAEAAAGEHSPLREKERNGDL